MSKGRLEAFSDAVIAIALTIMVLNLQIPRGTSLAALRPMLPALGNYVLSYVYLGIYWNNHHHLFHAAERVNGKILWANLHLLFWLSLVPFVTGWMGQNHFAPLPTATYGVVLLLAAAAWTILLAVIVAEHGPDSTIALAMGKDVKGKVSLVLYTAGVGLAFLSQWIALALYVAVALIWLIPDMRIESRLKE